MLPHCERGQERKGLELRRDQRPDQARPSRQQEEIGFYLKGNGKPLKGLKWSSDNDLITFPEGSQPTVGSMNWRDQEQKKKAIQEVGAMVPLASMSAAEMEGKSVTF